MIYSAGRFGLVGLFVRLFLSSVDGNLRDAFSVFWWYIIQHQVDVDVPCLTVCVCLDRKHRCFSA